MRSSTRLLPPEVEGQLMGHHAADADTVRVLDLARERRARMRTTRLQRAVWRWECWRQFRHCWHPADAMIGWACCCCPAETDGTPPSRCVECKGCGCDTEACRNRPRWQPRWLAHLLDVQRWPL